MAHPYPPHRPELSYIGRRRYFLTFSTHARRLVFIEWSSVETVMAQFLRAADEQGFQIDAYCFMPDHAHVLVRGLTDASDCRTFIKSAKQYSGYYYKRQHRHRLWQRYGFDRVVRDDLEAALVVRYILSNPVRSGLVGHPTDYPYVGSQCYTLEELLQWSEYRTSA